LKLIQFKEIICPNGCLQEPIAMTAVNSNVNFVSIYSLPDELTVIPLAFKTLIAVYCDNFTLDEQTDGKLDDLPFE
ncbi:hypothetical protein BpHYR1_038547, partial [Brachionus plicatilis]